MLPWLLTAAIVGGGTPVRWTAPADTTRPARRAHHAMIYDAAHRRVLLTGGSTPIDSGRRFVLFDDLWSFDGSGWRKLGSSGSPSSGRRLALDTDRGFVVSYGGYPAAVAAEVRVLEQDQWRTVGQHPTARLAEPGFVYDRARRRFVGFGGGFGRGEASGETWLLADTTWRRLDQIPSPPPRQAHVMEYDEARARVVVFGGMAPSSGNGPPGLLGDVWEFDGTSWTEIRAAGGPGPRASAGATYDSKRGLVVIFGGMTQQGMVGDTWAWDGAAWRKLADEGPPARAMGYLAYDQARDRVVMFGGRRGWPNDLDDTWEWDGARWQQVLP